MSRAAVRCYAELNDHLAPHQRYQTLEKEFYVPASLKDVIESFGIPHTEVELVLVNGESSDFSRLVKDGDRIAVYPVFESLNKNSTISATGSETTSVLSAPLD